MPSYIKSSLVLIFLLIRFLAWSQEPQKEEKNVDYIDIIHADHADLNEKYPDKKLLSGNVQLQHNEALLFCDKALIDMKENSAIALGNVTMKQGDTIDMKAEFVKYDGNTSFAEAFGDVVLSDPKMTLRTDTLSYDRKRQEAYYTTGGVIQDSVNTLKSQIGHYFLNEKKFKFVNNVHLTNPDYQIDSYQLNYYTDSGVSEFFGPTKIYNKTSYIYAEKGHHDSRREISWFVKNAYIKHKHTTIKGDSLYYDRKKHYATGSGNVVVHDSINKTWIYSNFAQRWEELDSIKVSEHPLLVSISEKDTLYTRADYFIAAGKKKHRKLWGYPNVRFFSNDFSGRCDSLYREDEQKVMKLMKTPILWNGKSQLTGERIWIKNDSLNQIDSLIIPKDVFIAQEDSLGYNQIKGRKLLGKFIDKKLHDINIYGNTEVIYYIREEDGRLTGIEKNKSSRIFLIFKDGEIDLLRLYEKVDGTIYPANKIKEQDKKFKEFIWHGDRQIKTKADVIENTKLEFIDRPKEQPTQTEQEEIIEFKKQQN